MYFVNGAKKHFKDKQLNSGPVALDHHLTTDRTVTAAVVTVGRTRVLLTLKILALFPQYACS